MAWLGRFDDFSHINALTRESKRPGVPSRSSNSNRTTPSTGIAFSSACREPGSYEIREITSDMQNVSVTGVVIAKESAKSIISKKGTGNERHLLAFTVCDAPASFINVTCWGTADFIQSLAADLSIGDVVDIKGAHVQAKSSNPADEKFKPWTPSPCQLNLSDNQGTITPYNGMDSSDYSVLLHVPTRANNDFYTLEDIQANGMNLQGEHINILTVVKKIWPVREIATKTGRKTFKADIVLCDETCPSFSLTLWDNFAHIADNWIPMETVIFAADVRISYNDFRSTMVASTDSKTIITVNPETPEAQGLQQFCRTQSTFLPLTNSDTGFENENKDPDVESITNVWTIEEAKSTQKDDDMSSARQPSYGIIYAFLSHFDVDGDDKTIFRNVCAKCRKTVEESCNFVCGNPDCSGGDFTDLTLTSSSDVDYSFTVSLSDHTGSLDFCWVPPTVAERILGYKARDFKNLSGEHKTGIKWNYLLERVKAVIKIRQATGAKDNRHYVRILSLEKVTPTELLERAFKDT